MSRPHLNFAQRVVVVVGLGVTFYFVALWMTSLGSRVVTGWVAYAPLSNSYFNPSLGGLHPWVRLVIWLAFVLLWIGISLALLMDPTPKHVDRRD